MDTKTNEMLVTHSISTKNGQNEQLEKIFSSSGQLIAYIVYRNYKSERTEFITHDNLNLQVGFIVYPQNGMIQRHDHRPIERHILGTQEVLIVRSGQLEMELYDESREFVDKRILNEGDVIIIISGGHGFRILKDTVLLEIKQGPYVNIYEKEYF